MLKKVTGTALVSTVALLMLCSCQNSRVDSYTVASDYAIYESMTFPDYLSQNPVRYMDENERGKYNGWQDFGKNGEIKTIALPMQSTYVYQMYSYFIRNDLQKLYAGDVLPEDISDIPYWIMDITEEGRRAFWYSMGGRIPDKIELVGSVETITSDNGICNFLKAEYKVSIGKSEEEWIVYFMKENGMYSALAIDVNEGYEQVENITDTIIKTYQIK